MTPFAEKGEGEGRGDRGKPQQIIGSIYPFVQPQQADLGLSGACEGQGVNGTFELMRRRSQGGFHQPLIAKAAILPSLLPPFFLPLNELKDKRENTVDQVLEKCLARTHTAVSLKRAGQ
ncbi:hypothetical protein PoB_007427500 [Plakobranchus ocellatus]|uniref:Uncharacterized protein n=1 Tax=Plakobranchus ocellatus TaxID=259542 RepID=A0AAV4DUD4_9GAST|nr:hypothetical protein PoB_007427500 [Plakobranchus ocellatus]